MPLNDLLFQTCTIYRISVVRGPDGDPTETSTNIATDIPCRFDSGQIRTLRNTFVEMKGVQIAGTFYIAGDQVDDTGKVLNIQYKDKIILDVGSSFEIYDLNKVGGFAAFDHYEVMVVDYENV